jgi:hypothetical protein
MRPIGALGAEFRPGHAGRDRQSDAGAHAGVQVLAQNGHPRRTNM